MECDGNGGQGFGRYVDGPTEKDALIECFLAASGQTEGRHGQTKGGQG